MFLLVGLGNVGSKYLLTRHNIGFLFLDFFADKNLVSWVQKSKLKSEIALKQNSDFSFVLGKPLTYMNLSGEAVSHLCSFYKIPSKNVIVVHDDIDLPFLDVRYKFGGGAAGHNGLRSINSLIGNEYHRIRLGVGRPENNRIDVADYVLSNFLDEQILDLESLFKKIAHLPEFITKSVSAEMSVESIQKYVAKL